MTEQPTATQSIRLIAVDVDGTLLNSQHQLSERNEKALREALAKGVHVILATGKTYFSATDIIRRLNLITPGIFIQGTMICNPDGSLRHQQTLDAALARRLVTFAEDRGFRVAIYSGSRLLVRKLSPVFDRFITAYGEPAPEAVGPLQNVMDSVPLNKLSIFGEDVRAVKALRWQLSMQVNGAARLVQAGVNEMVEILPAGASKGVALKTLLHDLKIPQRDVLAIGDAENDIEMLQLAGIGVAVGNAGQAVRDCAQHVVASNDADGVAEAVERFVLATAGTAEAVAGPETTAS